MSGWTYVLTSPLTILLVDDDPIFREFAMVNLGSPGVAIHAAADGVEGLSLARALRPDVLLVDAEMPKLDGFAVTRQVRSDALLARLPIIMVTGRDDIGSIDKAFEVGATSFTAKPVNWRLLSYQIKFVMRATISGSCTCHDHVKMA